MKTLRLKEKGFYQSEIQILQTEGQKTVYSNTFNTNVFYFTKKTEFKFPDLFYSS